MPFKFYIEDIYDRTEVNEPRGWMNIKNVLERDVPTHGMFWEYTDGSLKLGFACDGKTLLEAAYQDKGGEAYYLFEVEEAETDSSAFSVIFSGELDFTTRNYDEDFLELEVNKIEDLEKIKNRSSIKINLNKQLTLDGTIISNVNYDDSIMSLATKEFQQLEATNTGELLGSVQSDAATTTSILFGNVGFLDIQNDELKKLKNINTSLSTSDRFGTFFTPANDGALEFEFDIDIDLIITEDQGSVNTSYVALLTLVFDKQVKDNVGVLYSSVNLASDSDTSGSPNDVTLSLVAASTNRYAIIDAGTNVSIELSLTMTSTGTTQMSTVMDVNQFDLTVTDKIGITGTIGQWYQVHDALNKNLNFITNEYDFLYSELLGNMERGYTEDGCLSDMRIINGFRNRQINDADKAIQFTFKDFISNINVMRAIGYGIEELDSPIGLGVFQVQAQNIVANILTVIIPGDVTSSWDVGDFIGFFDSELLYGTWEITFIEYDGDFETTEIKIDVTGHSALYRAQNVTGNAYLTSNKTTALRNRLRVEKWEHFYKDTELIDLGVVQEYSEEVFTEAIYNEIDIGFKKYSNDENKPTTLEEIHTESTWSIPIIKADKVLNLSMSWIASTFLFNDSRNKIFSKKPTTSDLHDNSLFFCEKADKQGTYTVFFDALNNTIEMPADAYENIINGSDLFIISNADDVGNNGSYQIDSTEDVIFHIDDNEYLVPVVSVATTRVNDEVTIDHEPNAQQLYKPETNDLLLSSSGITRPSYFMNQRRTIKRFLIRWGSYIKSTLAYIADSVDLTIHNLTFDNNGAYTSQIDFYDLDSDCYIDTSVLTENENINTGSFEAPKFKPNLISCTVKVCDSDYDMIVDAHKNALQSPDDAKNYGYFTVTSPRGEVKTGWLMNLKRSPVNRIAKIQLLEKV